MLKKICSVIFSLAGSLSLLILSATPALADATTSPSTTLTTSSISANWSGYVADTSTYSSIGATWSVPIPSQSSNTRLATDATWVGIGGVKSQDLIQAGTQAVTQNGGVVYQAWYELLPDYQQLIPITVHGGDSVTVSLTETSPNLWHLSFKDTTTGADYEEDLSYNSSQSSAEWIEERPVLQQTQTMSYLPLDNFGTVNFTEGYTVANGIRESIAGAGAQSLTMANYGLQTLAVPSALMDDSFSIARSTNNTSPLQLSQLAINNNLSTGNNPAFRVWRRNVGNRGRQIVVQVSFNS